GLGSTALADDDEAGADEPIEQGRRAGIEAAERLFLAEHASRAVGGDQAQKQLAHDFEGLIVEPKTAFVGWRGEPAANATHRLIALAAEDAPVAIALVPQRL